MLRKVILSLSFAVTIGGAGCSFFQSTAPLPKPGAIEAADTPRTPDALDEIVQRADVLYLPVDRIESEGARTAGVRIVSSLRRSGAPFAVAWGVIPSDQQQLLSDTTAPNDLNVDKVSLLTPVRDREECQRLLVKLRHEEITMLAIHSREQQATEDNSYRFAAEQIVHYCEQRSGAKLLVLLNRRDIEAQGAVPFCVAQKSSLRQITLDARRPDAGGLLTLRSYRAGISRL